MSTSTGSIQGKVYTSRLMLRGATLGDVDALYECFRDGEVMRYWDTLPHATREVTLDWVESMIDGPANGVRDFVIVLMESSTDSISNEKSCTSSKPEVVIGKAGIWQDNEIGFLLNRAHWGKGLGLEALTALIDLTFGLSSLSVDQQFDDGGTGETCPESLIADVDPRNKASLGLLGKLGFEAYETKKNTFQIGDSWVDSVYLRLQRQAWVDRRRLSAYVEA